MLKNTLTSIFLKGLFFIGLQVCFMSASYAQASTPIVRWELQVLQEGRLVDSFKGATPLGQSYTATHRYPVNAKRACKDQMLNDEPDESNNAINDKKNDKKDHPINELSRTITVVPNYIALPLITFSIEAQEQLEIPHSFSSRPCSPYAEPRTVNASHPTLTVSEGAWSSWQILKKKPLLTYRLRARIATP